MPRLKKPSAAVLRALPLSQLPERPADILSACNICGKVADEYVLYREANEYDVALPEHPLVFIGRDHKACIDTMEKHPRLYVMQDGKPGSFPRLCGPCRFRVELQCKHPDLKENGGSGLRVDIVPFPPPGVIICPPPKPSREAVKCHGRDPA